MLSSVGFLSAVGTPIATAFGVTQAVTGDLNGDGIPDLVTVSTVSQTNVYLGTSIGTFSLVSSQVTGGQLAALGDFNNDGALDLASANGVMLGNGNGSFNSAVAGFSLPANTVSFITGNFDGDGNLDLGAETLTGSGAGTTLSIVVLPGLGTGTFGPPVNSVVATASGITGKYANFLSGDFNDDGILDLATPFGLMLGRAGGTFSTPIPFPFSSSPSTPVFTTGDFNGDGNLDVAVVPSSSSSASGAGQVELLRGNGDGTFADAGPVTVNASNISSIGAADISGDGLPDLVVGVASTGSGSDSIGVVPGGTGGIFGTASFFPVDGTPISIAFGDFNASGQNSIISIDAAPGSSPLTNTAFALNADVLINSTAPLAPPTVTLRSSTNPSVNGVAVQFTATVAAPSGSTSAPTGNVRFLDGTTVLGTGTLQPKNPSSKTVTATFTANTLPLGGQFITAEYLGDSTYAAITSSAIKQTVLQTAANMPLISAAINSVTLPSTFIAGDKGKISLALSNFGGAAAHGVVNINLFASIDGQIDSQPIAIPASSLQKLSVQSASGGSRTVNANFVAGGFPAGSYFILAQVVPVSGFTDDEISQTPAASANTFQAAGDVFGTVGAHKNLKFTVTNSGGGQATLSLSGPGSGKVTQSDSGQTEITVVNTLVGNTMTITTKGSFTFDNIDVTGPLGTLTAKTAGLSGTLTLAGGIKTLSLGSAAPADSGAAGPVIDIAANSSSASLTFGAITETTLDSSASFKSLSANSWEGGSIIAPSIGTLTVKGDLNADVLLHSGGKIATATIASISGGDWAVPGGIGTLKMNGAVSAADIFAGADSGPDNVLGTTDDIYAAAVISTLYIGGDDNGALIAAGAAPAGGSTIFGTLQLLPKGSIRSITVKGTASADSRILAVSLPTSASIGGAKVATAGDPRFSL